MICNTNFEIIIFQTLLNLFLIAMVLNENGWKHIYFITKKNIPAKILLFNRYNICSGWFSIGLIGLSWLAQTTNDQKWKLSGIHESVISAGETVGLWTTDSIVLPHSGYCEASMTRHAICLKSSRLSYRPN